MSVTVDNRVVEMRFDNKNFESNVAQSMSTLEKLKQTLNLTGATKGLEKVDAAAKSINFSGMSSGIETVKAKFSALEVMGVTALVNITNSALNAGKKIVSALTIDPVKTGFKEYETQINAIQTILANTSHEGTNIDQVNAALDELNTYADKTIYNFTEMTRNIGTFTAAGVKLDTSVSAIKGIANLAAMSGSTSQQASTAMYQLSQAIAAGRVSLQDWNSVVNAGMGGKIFQDALMNTAEAMGVVVDRSVSFRKSIEGKNTWLTSDILLNTLEQFTGDMTDAELAAMGFTKAQIASIQEMGSTATEAATKVKTLTQLYDTTVEAVQSGWAQSWRLILGDFEQARETFSKAADYIGAFVGKISDARNEMLKGAMSSPWEQLTEKIEASGVATEDFKKALKETAKEHGINVDAMINDQTTFEDTLKKGWLTSDIILETLKKMSGDMDGVSESTKGMTDKLEYFQKVVNEVWRGDYKNGEERIKALTAAGYDYAQVQSLVNKTVDGHKLTLEDLTDAQLKSVGYTDEQIEKIRALAKEAEAAGTPLNELIGMMEKKSGRELLFEGIGNIGQSLITLFESIGKAYEKIFPSEDRSRALYNAIAGFESLTEALVISDGTAENITKTFEGLFAVIDIIATLTGGALKFGFDVLKSVLGLLNVDIFEFTGNVGEAIVKLRDWIDQHNILKDAAEGVATAIVWLIDNIKGTVSAIDEWLDKFKQIPEVQAAMTTFRDKVGTVVGDVKGFFRGGAEIVGNFFEKLRNMDTLSLDGIKNAFREFREDLKGHFSGIDIDLSNVRGFFESFKNKLVETFKKLRTDASGAINDFRDDVDTGLSKVGDIFEKVKGKVKEFIDFLKSKFGEVSIGDIIAVGVGAGILTLATKLDNLVEFLTNPLEMLDGIADAFAKKIKAQAFNETAEAMIKLSVAIGILVAAVVVLANQDWEDVKHAGIILGVLAGGIVALSAAMKFLKVDTKALTGIAAMAGAILILVVALEKLVGIDGTSKEILASLAIVAGIAAALLGVLASMKKMKPGEIKSATSSAILLVSFAGAILMLVNALEDISNLTVSVGDVAALSAIMLSLGLVAKSISGISGKGGLGNAATLLAIPIAIKLIMGVLDDIAKFDASGVTDNMEAFAIVVGSFAGLMLSTRLAGEYAAKAGVGILAISAAIRLLIPAIKELGSMDQNSLTQGMVAIGILELIMGGLIAVSKLAGQHATKAGLMLIEMSAALLIMSGAIAIVAEIGQHNPDGLDRALLVVGTLEIVMAAMIGLSAYASEIKGVKGTLITLTVAVSLLALSIAGLSLLDEESIMSAASAMSMVMVAFAAIVAASSLAKKATGALVVMTAVVVALAGVLYALAELEVEASLGTAAALSLLMVSMAGALALMSLAGPDANGALVAMVAVTMVLVAVAEILRYLSDMNVEPSIETALSLSILMNALAAATIIMGLAGKDADNAVIALAGVVVALGFVAEILVRLDQMDVEPSIETAIALSILMGALSGVCVVLSTMGKASGIVAAAAKGALAFDIVVVAIGALLYGLGACMEYIPNCEEFINNGLPVLAKIGTGIGEFVGGLIGGALAGLVSGLPKIGEHLSNFIDKLQPFIAGAKNIDGKTVAGVAALAAAMVALTAASFIDGVSSLLSKIPGWPSMDDFAAKFESLGQGVAKFANAVGNVDGDAVKASAEAGAILGKLANSLPSYGGKIAEWFGEKMDLESFGAQIMTFGKYLAKYAKAITGDGSFDAEAVEASATAAMTLSELANSLPKYGGKLQEWFGEKVDLKTFGAQIMIFGDYLAKYSKTVSAEGAINPEAIEASTTAAKLLSDLANGLPKYGGKLQEWFSGERVNLSQFGTHIVLFGEKLAKYCGIVSAEGAIDKAAVENSTRAGRILTQLANSLPSYDGKISSWFGSDKVDLATFGDQIVTFGEGLAKYSDSVSGVQSDVVTNTASAAQVLSTLANSLPTKKAFDGKVTLEDFGKQLSKFGDKFYDFYENVSGIDIDKANKAVGIIQDLVDVNRDVATVDPKFLETFADALDKLSTTGLKSFIAEFSSVETTTLDSAIAIVFKMVDMAEDMVGLDTSGMSGFAKALKELATSSITKFVSEFKNGESKVKTAVQGLIDKAESAIESKSSDMSNAFKDIVTKSLNSINGRQQDFFIAGKTIAAGLINGVSYKSNDIANAFRTPITNSLTSINGRQQDFFISGKTIMAGLVSGIDFKTNDILTKVTTILDTAYKKANLFQQHFFISGKTIMVGLIDGIKNKEGPVYTTVTGILDRAYNAINTYQSRFFSVGHSMAAKFVDGLGMQTTAAYNAGVNLVTGFANGISDTTFAATAAATAMANAAVQAAEEALDENSPSKEMYSVGDYAGIGFVNALLDNVRNAKSAADELGESSIKALKDALARIKDSVNDNIDTQPVIRPVLDLSDVEKNARKIDAAFSRSQAVSISNERSRSGSAVVQNGEVVASAGSSFNFTQNNYSPKSLSRIEIYRQTKNQFSAMERKVKA